MCSQWIPQVKKFMFHVKAILYFTPSTERSQIEFLCKARQLNLQPIGMKHHFLSLVDKIANKVILKQRIKQTGFW